MFKSLTLRFLLVSTVCAISLSVQAGVNDTSQQAEEKPGESVRLEEIIVTANKREERLQDVPASIAVISSQDIDRRGLIGMEDYLRSVPGVNEIDNGPVSNAIVIRGITTSPYFENVSPGGPTVATYFGETPITGGAGASQGAIDVRPVDIDHIEVLRGPQGTTFGDSALGGALRIIPAKPQLADFSAKASASYSDTAGFGGDNSMIQGIVNIPVVRDQFALRIVGYRYDESGFYRNVAGIDPATINAASNCGLGLVTCDLGNYVRGFVENHVGQIVSSGARLAALWAPTEKLKISVNYLHQLIEENGTPASTIGNYEQTSMPVSPEGRLRGQAGDVADTNIDLANLVLTYDLGWSEWTSVASYVDSGGEAATDESGPFGGIPLSATASPSYFRSFSAETRLASHFAGRVQFLAGFFYEHVRDGYHETFDWDGTAADSPFAFLGFPSNILALIDTRRRLEQRALFGEVSYNLTSKLTATVGGRYFDYNKSEVTLNEGFFYQTQLGTGVPITPASREGHSNFKANLSFKPTEDVLLYALWSQGFRLGKPQDTGLLSALCDADHNGILDGTNVSINSLKGVNSDSLDNYEIGAKFTSLERRLTVDMAAYHVRWVGMPVSVAAPQCSGGAQPIYFANAGTAASDGVELQASFLVTPGLRVDGGGSYTNARLTEDVPAEGWFNGNKLPGSPKMNANLALQYDFAIAGRKAFVRAGSFYAGKFYTTFSRNGLGIGDYTKVDARAGLSIRDLTVELFVTNLTNSNAFADGNPAVGRPFNGYQLRPRTVGLQVGYDFGK